MFWQCKKGKSKNLTVPFMVGILLVHLYCLVSALAKHLPKRQA